MKKERWVYVIEGLQGASMVDLASLFLLAELPFIWGKEWVGKAFWYLVKENKNKTTATKPNLQIPGCLSAQGRHAPQLWPVRWMWRAWCLL